MANRMSQMKILTLKNLLLVAVALTVSACSTTVKKASPPSPAHVVDSSFESWLTAVKADAKANGISQESVDKAFEGLTVDPNIISISSRQPELTESFGDYLDKRLSPARITRGREMMSAHASELASVSEIYGVQSQFIVAVWGLETNYGSQNGSTDVVRALVTLAYTSPSSSRRQYFRKELLTALRILDEGHIERPAFRGSWAGAMGQGQFMPSSFLNFAQDFNQDGRRDIWTTPTDVFASIANYLKKHGWRSGVTWGRSVRVPDNYSSIEPSLQNESIKKCLAENQLSKSLPLAEWKLLGFTEQDGNSLPDQELEAALVLPSGINGPAFLVYENYLSILRYNCSTLYALTVGLLSDKISQ